MKIVAMSDLHLSKKPWQVRRAFSLAKNAELVLLAGDLVNDGTPEQFALLQQCISEVLPDVPVLAVAGNHDYPPLPSPMLRDGICDYPALQDWLLARQPYPYELDGSGAYAVQVGQIEVIGLNCVWHWRRFKFPGGDQLRWLDAHLAASGAARHILLCHAPPQAHNPKGVLLKPYLSRDDQLQQILDAHRNIIFLSGHTHICVESPGCWNLDTGHNNLYFNIGSIRPTTVLKQDAKAEPESTEGNLVRLVVEQYRTEFRPISMQTGREFMYRGYEWEGPGHEIECPW